MARRSRSSVSVAALRISAANRSLRRVQAARLASVTGRWAYTVTLAVYAYRQAGPGGVAIAALVRLIPAAAAASLTGLLASRVTASHLLLRGGILRAIALGGAGALVVAGAPSWLVYAAISWESAISAILRPLQNALLPALSQTPEELTSTNLALSVIESAGLLIGPLVGALLLHGSSVGGVFFVAAAAYLLSAVLLMPLPVNGSTPGSPQAATPSPAGSRLRSILSSSGTSTVIVLYGAQNLVAGALSVLIVVTALRLLNLGQSGVGALTAAVGLGGVVGGGLVLTRLHRRRHATDLALGLALWSAPVLALAFNHSETVAFVLLAIVGVGVTVVDVSAVTLLQRAAHGELLTHALGLLQAVFVTSVGIGTLGAPLLIDAIGARGALLVTGGVLPVLAISLWRRLSRADDRVTVDSARVDLLASISIFAPLTEQALERLASELSELRLPAGEVVMRQGDLGDAFYVVEHGAVEVEIDGAVVRDLGPSDFFGEIALLRDVPRTATVRAVQDLVLLRLEREAFLAIVIGNAQSASAARGVIGTRLGAVQPA